MEVSPQQQSSPSGSEPSGSFLYRLRSSENFILLAVCVAIFNDVFLFGTIIPVLPYALPHRVDVNLDDVQIWIAVLLATYGGALLIGSLLFGWIGDRLTHRYGLFVFGLTCLALSTILISVGRHIALLMLGRFLQGLAAAVVWTSGLALLTDIFGQERYGEAVGYGQTAVSIGTTSAPLLGGIVYGHGGFFAASVMSIVSVSVSLLLALLMIEPKAKSGKSVHEPQSFSNGNSKVSNDIPGAVPVERQISENSTVSVDSTIPDERTALIPQKPRRKTPVQGPAYLKLLRSGRVLAAMQGIFTYAFVIISFEGIIPLFVKETFHWNPTRTALIFLCWIIPGFLGPLAGKASDKYGSRWIAAGGFLFAVTPLILMRLVTENNTGQKVLLYGLLTLVGLGFSGVIPSCVSDLTAAAADLKREHPSDFGDKGASTQAFGLFVSAYSCGTLIGPTVAGLIKAKMDWGASTLLLACACVIACFPIVKKILKTPASSRKASTASDLEN